MPKVVRIYAGQDGESHFENTEIPLPIVNGDTSCSQTFKAAEFSFRGSHGKKTSGFHTVPCRQLIVMIEGEMEIEVSGGSKRIFRPGQIILADDTTGHGHKSKIKDRVSLIIPLAEDQKIA
jgi:quercetin dioxygenase-like cupin family protein